MELRGIDPRYLSHAKRALYHLSYSPRYSIYGVTFQRRSGPTFHLAIIRYHVLQSGLSRPPAVRRSRDQVWGQVFPWCSGYHIRLTRGRPPVRSRAETALCTKQKATLVMSPQVNKVHTRKMNFIPVASCAVESKFYFSQHPRMTFDACCTAKLGSSYCNQYLHVSKR